MRQPVLTSCYGSLSIGICVTVGAESGREALNFAINFIKNSNLISKIPTRKRGRRELKDDDSVWGSPRWTRSSGVRWWFLTRLEPCYSNPRLCDGLSQPWKTTHTHIWTRTRAWTWTEVCGPWNHLCTDWSEQLEICLCVYVRGGLGKPEPSNVSLHSKSSIHRLIDFRDGHHREDRWGISIHTLGNHRITPWCQVSEYGVNAARWLLWKLLVETEVACQVYINDSHLLFTESCLTTAKTRFRFKFLTP